VVDHQDLSQLEILLTRADSAIILPLSMDALTEEGEGVITQIHDFDGLPARGVWIVQIRVTASGIAGKVNSLSIASLYTSDEQAPPSPSENDGEPASERITDEVILDYVPENIYLEGQFRYVDRLGHLQPARDVTVEIWDQDEGG
jgi:hypothetical protein